MLFLKIIEKLFVVQYTSSEGFLSINVILRGLLLTEKLSPMLFLNLLC